MNVETKAAQTVNTLQADYGLRGMDFETTLIGPSVSDIWDADRLVRAEWSNGFPNWAMYRCAMAGDEIHLPALRRWAVAFSIAYCTTGGVKDHAYSEDLACVAAWDALHLLIYTQQFQPYTVSAEALGVDPKTYLRLRTRLYRRMRASMDEYWIRLQVAFRQVVLSNRNF